MPNTVNSFVHLGGDGNVSQSSQVLHPTAYTIEEIVLTNFAGKEYDVQKFVTDFSITESIYRLGLTISMNIKDPINLMEELRLTGQEKITVKLSRAPINNSGNSEKTESVKHEFYVTEYPVFAKYNNRIQVYSVRGVSRYAFLSKFKRISRSFSGNIKEYIRAVLTDDLHVPADKLVVSNASSGNIKFIVPNINPLDSIYWAMRRAYSSDGSPFYCYENILGEIHITSQADMALGDSYREFKDAKFFESDPDKKPGDVYEERASRIFEIVSDLKMSKFVSGASGAYSSRTEYLDLSTKTHTTSKFNYDQEFEGMKTIDTNKTLSSKFVLENSDSLSNYDQAKLNFISLNSKAYDVNTNGNYHSPTSEASLNKAQSYLENMEHIMHDVTVAGDFSLNSGKIITLRLPPSVDPEVKRIDSQSGNNPTRDEFLSGKYLVTSVTHNFSEEYYCEMRVKKDSFETSYF